jgi:integrase
VGTKPKARKLPKRQGVAKPLTTARIISLGEGRHKDPGQQGLYLLVRDRLNGSASRTWVHRIKRRGADTYLPVGHYPETGLAEARTTVQAQREQLTKGIDPMRAAPRRKAIRIDAPVVTGEAGKHSVEFLAKEFLEKYIAREHKQPEYTRRILDVDVLTTWRGRDARSIKPREVIELLDNIVERGSNVMANRTADVLGMMFKYGVHRNIVESNPVQLLFRPGGKESSRERCLTDIELKAILSDPKAATRFERLSHAIVIFLLTAVRRSELALASWSEIDFDAKTWRIPGEHVKGRKGDVRGHTVPLSDWAVREFEALQRLAKHSRWVLANEADDGPINPKLLTRGLARCQERMKKLGIAEFTLHDLRRTCRTGLSRLKIAPHISERVLNHRQEKIAGTYDLYDYVDEKRDALNKWAAHLDGLKGSEMI